MNIEEHDSPEQAQSNMSDRVRIWAVIAAVAVTAIVGIGPPAPPVEISEQVVHLIGKALAPILATALAIFVLLDAGAIHSRLLRWGYTLSAVILIMEVLFVIGHWLS